MKRLFSIFLAIILILIPVALSAQKDLRKSVRGKIMQDKELIPNYDNMRVLLDPGSSSQRLALPTTQGNFAFYKVSPGMHLIQVLDQRNRYIKMVVVVHEHSENEFYEFSVKTSGPGAQLMTRGGHLVIHPSQPLQYFERKEPFNIMKLIISPYGLMGFMAFMVMFVMPRMPKPDKAQMQEMMGTQNK